MFNIAAGAPISMRALAELVGKIVGNPAVVVRPSGQEDAEEDYRAWFAVERANRELGWYPQVSFADGVRELWQALAEAPPPRA